MRLSSLFKKPGHDSISSNPIENFHFESGKTQQLMVQVTQLNNAINLLKNNLKEKEEKVNEFKKLIIKYETILKEELLLYRLQQNKIKAIHDAYQNHKSFMKEIQNQITLFFNTQAETNRPTPNYHPLRRIIFRFFHQKEFNETITQQKLCELETMINKKQKLIRTFQAEIKKMTEKECPTASKQSAKELTLN